MDIKEAIIKVIKENNFLVFKDLIETSDINLNECIDNENNYLLHLIVLNNQFEMLQFVLEKGVDVNLVDKHQKTPIMYTYRNTKLLKLLLNYGANVHFLCNDKISVLLIACANLYFDSIEVLLDHGANLNQKINMDKEIITVYDFIKLVDISASLDFIDLYYMRKEMKDLWILEKMEFHNFLQWLPRELLEDLLDFFQFDQRKINK